MKKRSKKQLTTIQILIYSAVFVFYCSFVGFLITRVSPWFSVLLLTLSYSPRQILGEE